MFLLLCFGVKIHSHNEIISQSALETKTVYITIVTRSQDYTDNSTTGPAKTYILIMQSFSYCFKNIKHLHTYHPRFIPEGVSDIPPKRLRFTKII
jgi:hypothetical protein